MGSPNTIPRALAGFLAPVPHPQLTNKRPHHYHPISPVLTLTLSQHHTERIHLTPQDSARHPLRRLRLNRSHDSGQPHSHKRRLDQRLTPLHARLQRLPPARLLLVHQLHLAHHLSRLRLNPHLRSRLSWQCPRRPSRDYPFTR